MHYALEGELGRMGLELTVLPFQKAEVRVDSASSRKHRSKLFTKLPQERKSITQGAPPSEKHVMPSCVSKCRESTLSVYTAAMNNRNTRSESLTTPGLVTVFS